MNGETLKILLLLLAGAAVCGALHWLIGVAQRRLARRVDASLVADATGQPSLRKLLFDWTGNAVRTLVWLVYFAFLIHLLPQTRAGFESVGYRLTRLREQSLDWLFNQGINVVIIIVAMIFLMRFAAALIKTAFVLYERGAAKSTRRIAPRRVKTLSAIFSGSAQTVIIFIGTMTLLQQLRVNVTPILASAGVVGLAVGFGAQSLIKDLFAGLLILLEDQFNVGDTVKIGETTGTVEHLTLRATWVRAVDGALTIIPNGSIATVANLSRDWARVVLDVEVDYAEDVDRATEVINETARQMRAELPVEIVEDPTMLGLDKLSAAALTLRLLVKTAPNRKDEIARELRRRIKLAFDRAGIKAPASQQQLVLNRQREERRGDAATRGRGDNQPN